MLLIPLTAIRVLQLQKEIIFFRHLAQWAGELGLRNHLDDRPQLATSKGNLDSIANAVK